MTKRCAGCGTEKSADCFYTRASRCKECSKELRETKYKERIKKNREEYKQKNRDELREYNRQWRELNKGYSTEWQRRNVHQYYGI